MRAGQNPYYNPVYADAARGIASAIAGDPEKAGAIAYNRARARHEGLAADRQQLENDALSYGLEDAFAAGGIDPAATQASMPALLAAMARAGIANPANYTSPAWAMNSAAQSGAAPAEAYARAAYVGKGSAVPLDLALTPERADAIRAQENAADMARAVAVANIGAKAGGSGGAGGKPLTPVQMDNKDYAAIMDGAFGQIPGVADDSGEINPAAIARIPAGRLSRARAAGEEVYQRTRMRSAASDAALQELGIPPNVTFGVTGGNDWIPFNERRAFIGPDGRPYNFDDGLPVAADPAVPLLEQTASPALLAPSQRHIDALRANPAMAADFDAKFGAGAASSFLGQ